jgi:two-component system nitrogen regulation sensor histidine kinase NtrY
VEIADDGVGLPEGYRQRLYEPYFSTKKMGTGLGLAIVHQIVTDHGGRIELLDNKPRGTRVILTLPLTLQVAEGSAEPVPAEAAPA